jgi:hypothetical protein
MASNPEKLTVSEWKKVIRTVQSQPTADLSLFILRCLANSQQVSYHAIAAFKGEITEDLGHVGQKLNTYIGTITSSVNKVCDLRGEASWYIWHTTDKAWVISWSNLINLRKAFGAKD